MKRNDILMIMPYFGALPRWFNLYLYTCIKNSFIDFLFITDCKGMNIPPCKNIKVVFETFGDYCLKVSNRLNINFCPELPYKICDLRPFFAIIHEEYLKGYKFWGYGDIDVVYGNLRLLLPVNRLMRYDVISAHSDRLAGHFTVIRKESKYSRDCYNIKDWERYLESNNVYGLDEHHFTEIVYPAQKFIWMLYRRVGKHLGIKYYSFFDFCNIIPRIFQRLYMKEFLTSVLPQDGEIWQYNTRDGKITNPQNKEIPYLHFLFFKKTKFYNAKTYWGADFWQVNDDKLFNTDNTEDRTICFTNHEIYERK